MLYWLLLILDLIFISHNKFKKADKVRKHMTTATLTAGVITIILIIIECIWKLQTN